MAECNHEENKIPVHNFENKAYCPQCEEEVIWHDNIDAKGVDLTAGNQT